MTKRFIGIKELAEYVDIKKKTIYSWVNQRKIPYVKVGRLIRFDWKEINEWLENNSITVYNNLKVKRY